MPITIENKTRAARHLLHMTGLDTHVLVRRYIDIDKSPTDWDWQGLHEEDRLSSGELVIIGVLRAIVLLRTDVTISDLTLVDDDTRHICLDALRIAYIGDEVSTL